VVPGSRCSAVAARQRIKLPCLAVKPDWPLYWLPVQHASAAWRLQYYKCLPSGRPRMNSTATERLQLIQWHHPVYWLAEPVQSTVPMARSAQVTGEPGLQVCSCDDH
jgi:hypothetical protein